MKKSLLFCFVIILFLTGCSKNYNLIDSIADKAELEDTDICLADNTQILWFLEDEVFEGSIMEFISYLDNEMYETNYEHDEMINPLFAFCDMNSDRKKDLIIQIDNCGGNTIIIIPFNDKFYGLVKSVRECQAIYKNGLIEVSGGRWKGFSCIKIENGEVIEYLVAKEDFNSQNTYFLDDISVDKSEYECWIEEKINDSVEYEEMSFPIDFSD